MPIKDVVVLVIDIVNSLLSRHIIDNCESILRQINPIDIHLLCNSSVRSLLGESKCNPINVPLCDDIKFKVMLTVPQLRVYPGNLLSPPPAPAGPALLSPNKRSDNHIKC